MNKTPRPRSLKKYQVKNLRPGDIIQAPMTNEWFVVRKAQIGELTTIETVCYNNETVPGPTLTETGLYGYKIVIFE